MTLWRYTLRLVVTILVLAGFFMLFTFLYQIGYINGYNDADREWQEYEESKYLTT